jgi:hypothetical protein
MTRTNLVQSGLPKSFWAEAVRNAAAIHSHLPQAGGMSPFEKLYGRKPSENKFRPFGCLAYLFQHEINCKKPDNKSIPCILRATLENENYRAYDLATRKVYVSRHVEVSKNDFLACILTKNSKADDMESQSDYSDSGISLGVNAHGSSGNNSEASSQFEGDGEASAYGEIDQDDEEGKMTKKETLKMTKVVQVKAQMMSMPRSAHLPSGLKGTQLRNPKFDIKAGSSSSRRVSGLIEPHVLHSITSTTRTFSTICAALSNATLASLSNPTHRQSR